MKKILLLGGSAQQVVAITTAKQLGYYTVLCDYLPDNPGQYEADQFYLVSTTDKEAVLQIAQKEKIEGVLAYASDPAAPTAAYVSEQLGLPGNPATSVEILCNKDKFRLFLKNNGFNAPTSRGYSDKQIAMKDTSTFQLPVIVKPVDSSGSKGATVIYSWDDLSSALDDAFLFSRSYRIIIEEFIERKHEYLIGGDIFIVDGQVKLWGLLNCHRDKNVNALVPVGKSYPLLLGEKDVQNVKDTLQRLVTALELKSGSVNVELVIDKNNKVWPIDIGPRAGGNMIPDFLGLIFGIDIVKLSVLAAMGQSILFSTEASESFYATHNLHSAINGEFLGVKYSDDIRSHVIKECIYKKAGDSVEFFDNAAKAIGIVFMKFDSVVQMESFLRDINSHIKISLKERA
ncbi:acetyl-CoA carboxylase biotin carboxylase subunit family protein [Mediterraneibacter gnavus]